MVCDSDLRMLASSTFSDVAVAYSSEGSHGCSHEARKVRIAPTSSAESARTVFINFVGAKIRKRERERAVLHRCNF